MLSFQRLWQTVCASHFHDRGSKAWRGEVTCLGPSGGRAGQLPWDKRATSKQNTRLLMEGQQRSSEGTGHVPYHKLWLFAKWWPSVARWYLLFGMALSSKAPNLIKDHNLEGPAGLPSWPRGTNVGSAVCPEACCPPILHLGFSSGKGDTSTASIRNLQWGIL